MKINLKRVDDAFKMVGTNELGEKVSLDAAKSIGGTDSAFRPMQLLLVSLAGCSAIDILNILYKQKQVVNSFEVDVEGDRHPGPPTTFKNVQVHISIAGTIDEIKLQKAIDLTVDKYCSVYHILKLSATISYTYAIQ